MLDLKNVCTSNFLKCRRMKFCCKTGKAAKETYNLIKMAFGDEALGQPTVSQWYRCFQNGLESGTDSHDLHTHPPMPLTLTLIQNNSGNAVVQSGQWLTVWEMAEYIRISALLYFTILTENLGMWQVCTKLIP
jgi:hypothetical protein